MCPNCRIDNVLWPRLVQSTIVDMAHDSDQGGLTGHATQLLHRAGNGDQSAAEELLPLVYEELRARAGAYFRRLPANHTLQPTALVHEAYVKLVNAPSNEWKNRAHFCAVAATAMRQILINHAKRRVLADKARQNHADATYVQSPSSSTAFDVLMLDEALNKLAERNTERARLVELRFFGGLTQDEVAAVLGTSVSTVEREWRRARAWLVSELRGEDAP